MYIIQRMDNSFVWNIIHSFFKDDPQSLVRHHVESYNDFFTSGIYKIFKEKNPIRIQSRYDPNLARYDDKTKQTNPELGFGEYRSQAILYLGGKDGSRIYFGKPVIYDEGRAHYMYPNEARLRNMTYGMTIHYDVEIEYIDILEEDELPKAIGANNIPLPNDSSDDEGEGEGEGEGEYVNFKAKNKAKKGGNIDENEIDDEGQYSGQASGQASGGQASGSQASGSQASGGQASGGAGPVKKPFRKQANKRGIITPNETAEIRELTEKSMVAKNVQKTTVIMEKIYLGKFPIMLQSNFCILNDLSPDIRFQMGECKNDIGGYFIIDGKEKVIVPQEKFADNMLYIRKDTNDLFLYSAEIRSVSENVSKPIRTLSVKIMAPTNKLTCKNIIVNVPNVRKPVPLFILFRALGIISDKDIITMCLYDLDKYEDMLDLFIPSIHEAGGIMTQKNAIDFIAVLTKGKTTETVLEILADYFLPHVGETNFIQKAYYLGHIVMKLLKVYTGIEHETNRDNFKFKRIETPGFLIADLFREYYTIQQKEIKLGLEKVLYFNQDIYESNLSGLINENRDIFMNKIVDAGFKKGFKGNWGAQTHTKRIGVIQDLNRLSHSTMLSHLRKTTLHLDASVKLVGPRVLHASQWGYFDPIDTPDGGNIGLHKHLSISAYITKGISREPLIKWMREKVKLRFVEECSPILISQTTKVFVNGYWAGMVEDPLQCVNYMKLFRRNGLLPIFVSVSFDIRQNTIFIYTDEGRLTRPIFYRDLENQGKFFFDEEKNKIAQRISENDFTWEQLITGFNEKKKDARFYPKDMKIYELYDLYEGVDSEINPAKVDRFIRDKAVVDYIDTSESEDILIAINQDVLKDENTMKKYTHLEIDESFIFGMMCNLIPFPQNNPATRNSFSCGQSKQAVSLYHTNYQFRMDKSAVVLASPQIPLIKTRYMDVINGEENLCGENAIVAIMCYGGYNMEDAVLINEGSLKRGLFRTTYYSTYETHEEKSSNSRDILEKETIFTNIENAANIIGTKPGYEYNHLDEYGLIREGTEVHDKMVLIGMSSMIDPKTALKMDASKTPKKGQLGIVDKSFITDGEEGERIAKVRVREIRIPAIGDKMASRSGQKGTIGNIIPEADMPFTRDGLRPDIIVNPHAIPSRMTVGQLVECLTGKACSMLGCFGDGTAFNHKGTKIGQYAEVLTKNGFHSSGNDVLYNGMTGEQLESEIFIGPTYYMRLKHMVKDKINFRARGPRTALTKQPVSGRANDGGLRIGEMERDSIISHGAASFLTESMMERGDKYYMAVCNTTGMIAVYNPAKNLFMSPMADGPLRFVGSIIENNLTVENITKFGRSFSIVCIPYSLKLLMQELQCANVAMRIITEDNIDQIENLSFSKNINLLTMQSDTTPTTITRDLQRFLINEKMAQDKKAKRVNELEQFNSESSNSPGFNPQTPEGYIPVSPGFNQQSPPYAEGSPAYAEGSPAFMNQNESPPYTYGSPAYAEGSPASMNQNESPPYAEGSPAFMNENESPPYAEGSPAYAEGSPAFVVGDLVSKRGGGNNIKNPNNVWKVENIGPEFTTITDYNNGSDLLVVDNNEIYPYTPNTPNQTNLYDPFQQPRFHEPPMYQMPMQPQYQEPQKPPDVNVVVVTGDKNELNGIPLKNTNVASVENQGSEPKDIVIKKSVEDDKKSGGGGESGSSSSIFDLGSYFKIKKV